MIEIHPIYVSSLPDLHVLPFLCQTRLCSLRLALVFVFGADLTSHQLLFRNQLTIVVPSTRPTLVRVWFSLAPSFLDGDCHSGLSTSVYSAHYPNLKERKAQVFLPTQGLIWYNTAYCQSLARYRGIGSGRCPSRIFHSHRGHCSSSPTRR